MPRRRTRHQHTVARTYLSGFADPQGMVVMHRRSGLRKPVFISDAAVRRDFYTYVDDRGDANEGVEDWLGSSIEGPAAGPLRSARAGIQPSAKDIPALARFVAVSLMRTATARSCLQQIDTHIRPMLVLIALAKEKGYDLLEFSEPQRQNLLTTVAGALSATKTDSTWERRSLLRTMLRKADELMTILSTWNWRLDQTTTACLLTADAPVATITSLPIAGWGGILPQNSSVFLPVSQTQLLVASRVPLLASGTVSPQLASRINTELCRNANDAVYTHPNMPWSSDLTLATQGPNLPTPQRNWTAPESDETPTFPATYPLPADPAIAALLDDLGAVETVE